MTTDLRERKLWIQTPYLRGRVKLGFLAKPSCNPKGCPILSSTQFQQILPWHLCHIVQFPYLSGTKGNLQNWQLTVIQINFQMVTLSSENSLLTWIAAKQEWYESSFSFFFYRNYIVNRIIMTRKSGEHRHECVLPILLALEVTGSSVKSTDVTLVIFRLICHEIIMTS